MAMLATAKDITFQILDIQARDQRVEQETEDAREVVYESLDEASDDEFTNRRKRRGAFGDATTSSASANIREFIIHLFGSTSEGKPLRVDVTGYKPSFYLRLPEEHTSRAAQAIRDYLKSMRIDLKEVSATTIIHRKQFYGFTANRLFPFLEIVVPSLDLYKKVRNLFLDDKLHPATKRQLDSPLKGKSVEVYEANLDPMLRFLHVQNLNPCGWAKVIDGVSSIQDKDATEWVLDAHYEDIVPTENPSRPTAPFLTASWDIECYSATGDFPVAKRNWTKIAKGVLECSDSISAKAYILTMLFEHAKF
jgi:DNA polymerase elongation subunit (family B)